MKTAYRDFEIKAAEYGFIKRRGFNYIFEDDGIKVKIFKLDDTFYYISWDKVYEERCCIECRSIEDLITELDIDFSC